MVRNSLFHLCQAFIQPSLNDMLHQRLLIYQETHVIADELLRSPLTIGLLVDVLIHRSRG
ncbi:MAG: hypothetical protein IJV25_01410 [Prevotella sp.]|nr:hypothetical protein [Prevotella sp.]